MPKVFGHGLGVRRARPGRRQSAAVLFERHHDRCPKVGLSEPVGQCLAEQKRVGFPLRGGLMPEADGREQVGGEQTKDCGDSSQRPPERTAQMMRGMAWTERDERARKCEARRRDRRDACQMAKSMRKAGAAYRSVRDCGLLISRCLRSANVARPWWPSRLIPCSPGSRNQFLRRRLGCGSLSNGSARFSGT